MRDLFTFSDAADCGDQAQGDCGAGSGGGEDFARDQCPNGGASWSLVRFSRYQARRYLSSRVFAARSAPKEGSLERFADGDEGAGDGDSGEGPAMTHERPVVANALSEISAPLVKNSDLFLQQNA